MCNKDEYGGEVECIETDEDGDCDKNKMDEHESEDEICFNHLVSSTPEKVNGIPALSKKACAR